MSVSFESYDFNGNESWMTIERNLVFPPEFTTAQIEQALLKRKRKWFQANVDENFTWAEETPKSSASTSSSSASSSSYNSSSSTSSSASSASSSSSSTSSSSSPRSSSSSSSSSSSGKPKSSLLLSYGQLLLHVGILFIFVFGYVLPILGLDFQNHYAFFYTTLLIIAQQALTLYKSHGKPRFDSEYGRRLFMDEQSHFLFSAVVCINAPQMFMLLFPHSIRSLLFISRSLEQLYPASKRFVAPITARGTELWVLNSNMEVYTGIMLLILILTPQRSLMVTFAFWQYLRIRYMLSTDSQRAFGALRLKIDNLSYHSMCPSILRTGWEKLRDFLIQQNDMEYLQRQAQEAQNSGGIMSKCTIM